MVIGGGPGGYATALYGAAAGLSVAIVELDKVGGTCLHRGCVPAKEFLETASVFRTVTGAGRFGVSRGGQGTPRSPSTSAVSQARKQEVVDVLYKGLAGLMKGRGITVFSGSGTLLPGHRVRVAGNDGSTDRDHRHRRGAGRRGRFPGPSLASTSTATLVLTSDEVLALEELPESVAVIGGGAIGCEFASMLSDLGSKVTVFEALPSILNSCDEDVVKAVARSFRKRGIDVEGGRPAAGPHPGPVGEGNRHPVRRRREAPGRRRGRLGRAGGPAPRACSPRAPGW